MISTLTRRPARVLAAAGLSLAVVSALAGTSAVPATAAPSATTGLFGSADPTYDGVYRQSMALLGLVAADAPVPARAVTWLAGQQCASGAFQAYRSDLSVPCSAPDPQAFSGPDSNSTALAAMTLLAVGRTTEARRAVTALRGAQNADGGWGYTLGSASDVNSTGLALAALRAFPATTEATGSIRRATGYLRAAQLPCTEPAATRFAMPYQPGQPANALASVQALVGLAGTLPIEPSPMASLRDTSCRSSVEQRLSAHVDRVLRSTQGRIPSAFDSAQTDWNATATAVGGLASAGFGSRGIAVGITALGRNVTAYTGTGATASPAALGTLIQAAVAAGKDPRSFGTTRANLVSQLTGTLQK